MTIKKFAAPALPTAPVEYDHRRDDQLNQNLRIYFNNLDVFLAVLSTPQTGTTADRPTLNLQVGQFYFDTTINTATYWTGTQWVDSLGNPLVAVTSVLGTLNIGSVVVTTL